MNEISYYNTIALVSLIVCILLMIIAILIWVKLDIKHYFAVLTGSEARKSIDKIRQDAQSGEVHTDRRRRTGRAVISWNTSEGLEAKGSEGTALLGADNDRTTLLGQPGADAMSDPYATMVLSTIDQQSEAENKPGLAAEGPESSGFVSTPGFVVEKEIVNTAGNDKT